MKVTASVLFLITMIPVLSACVASSIVQTPLGFTMTVIDIPCKDVVNSIPANLKKRNIFSVWINENEGLLSVGPVTDNAESGSAYSRIRHTYQLSITCGGELSTNITGKAALEGLNTHNEWKPITDVQTVEKVALEFIRSLDLISQISPQSN